MLFQEQTPTEKEKKMLLVFETIFNLVIFRQKEKKFAYFI